MRFFLIVSLFFVAGLSSLFAQSVISAEHNRNLWKLDNTELLFDYHKQTVEDNQQFFTYPRRDNSFIHIFAEHERSALIFHTDSLEHPVNSFGVAVSPIAGLYYNDNDEIVQNASDKYASEAGLYMRGFIDSLDYDLDVRAYSENRSADGNEDLVHYRGHLGFNFAWIRISLARDVLHWGPGYYNNLAFNQNALPYNMINLDITFGPIHVFSIYTNLYDNDSNGDKINKRNLYAHRYELALGNLTMGMSEIQVLYSENKPWLFTPIVPLFIEKGNYTELVNNGALSFDINYRLFHFARIYGEFYLDDMISPVALYKNEYSNNRWAAMFGMQIAHDIHTGDHLLQLGSITEVARIEPYTYCHYKYSPALLAHQGFPLGNPNGPNNLTIDWTLYGKYWLHDKSNFFIGFHNKWKWKGEDNGSDIYDPYKTERKRFIHNAPLQYSLTPMVNFRGERFSISGEYSFFGEKNASIKMIVMM